MSSLASNIMSSLFNEKEKALLQQSKKVAIDFLRAAGATLEGLWILMAPHTYFILPMCPMISARESVLI